jgi:hypothetical protein
MFERPLISRVPLGGVSEQPARDSCEDSLRRHLRILPNENGFVQHAQGQFGRGSPSVTAGTEMGVCGPRTLLYSSHLAAELTGSGSGS